MSVLRAYKGVQPKLGRNVFIADTATVIGDVELGDEVSIWYGAALRGDVGKIRIGERSNVQDNATIHMTWEQSDAIIGAEVVIGHNAVVHGAIVEDRALIGIGAILLDNVHVGEGAWVAAGSVVSPKTVIPKGMLFAGAPARPVRPVREREMAWAAGAIQRYLGLAREHEAERGEPWLHQRES